MSRFYVNPRTGRKRRVDPKRSRTAKRSAQQRKNRRRPRQSIIKQKRSRQQNRRRGVNRFGLRPGQKR